MSLADVKTVDTYSFTPADLRVAERRPGVSAFMRIRNGAYSLEAAIRSHISQFDEIVAVYNRCTDETPDILSRLAGEFGPKLRVFEYLPSVFPPGSEGHAREPANSPRSLVNYYNFALAQTRFSHATKLDDDHIAMPAETAQLLQDVRKGRAAQREMACFSGLNLARTAEGEVGILAREPFSGSGDIGVFPVGPDTYFTHDRRFELFNTGGLPRRFRSIVYWHLKYLKPDFGFGNYDLQANPQSRYAKRLPVLQQSPQVIGFAELARRSLPWPSKFAQALPALPWPERTRIIADRQAAATALRDHDLASALRKAADLLPFLLPPAA